jgi:hypothetical protein
LTPHSPAWSPDGSKIAFHAWDYDLDGYRIYEMPSGGGDAVARTQGQGEQADYSPDGARLVFESERDGNQQLYVVDSQGTETRLTNHPGVQDTHPDWGYLEASPPPAQGNVNCDATVTSVDALQLLRYVAGMNVSQPPGCPAIGSEVASLFGDVDCNGSVTSVDALKVLRYVAGLPVAQTEPCTDLGELESG